MVASRLDVCKWKNDKTLNHRCPYCGDSQKNKHKARGYHFQIDQNFIYKCHNCGKSTSSIHFLKDHFPDIHREYLKEYLQEKGGKIKVKKQKMPSANDFKFKSKNILNTTRDDLSAVAVRAWEKRESREYLQDRQIGEELIRKLWYVYDSNVLSYLSSKYKDRNLGKDPRIVFPFYSENGELIGVSGRAINDTPLRYLTMRFVDDVPLIYNINNVDKSKTIYVTEGPIDSLFLPNSIAVGGSDFKKIQNLKENAIIIYDNEPRNTEIIKKIDEVIDLGFTVCIWGDKRVEGLKDINDMIMNGMTQNEIVEVINSCTYSGLSAKLKLQEYKKT
tara:strand:- start:1260 stop:2255 length:996 start_codon:yes stop_codon:yes gene_type:complete